jgi:Methyltransferase FkbM domain
MKKLLGNLIDPVSQKIKIDPQYKKIKLDIGLGNNALHSTIWLSKEKNIFNNLLVFGFEPDPRCIKELKDSSITSSKKIPTSCIGKNFHLIPVALGNVGVNDIDVATLYLDKDPYKSSLYHPRGYDSDDEEGETKSSRVDVPYYSLNHFIELLPNDVLIDHVKINANGADFNIIKGASKYLDRIVVLTFNANNDYENSYNNYYDTIRYLRDNGFVDSKESKVKGFMESFSIDPTFFNTKYLHLVPTILYYQIGDLSR